MRNTKMIKITFLLLLCIFVQNTITAQEVSVYPQLGHQNGATSAVYNPNTGYMASSCFSGEVRIWDIENSRELKNIKMTNNYTYSMIWNKDGSRLICGTIDGLITILDYINNSELKIWTAHRGPINSLSLSHDGTNFISASFDRTIKKWNSETGEELAAFFGFESIINQAVYSTDGQRIIAALDDGTIRTINAVDGRELQKITAHDGPVLTIAISSNGLTLASGGNDGLIKFWNVSNGILINTINAHSGPVSNINFSPDNTRLVSCSMDMTVKEWLVASGENISEFTKHYSYVKTVVYNKNGSSILSASFDSSIRESSNGQEIKSFSGYSRGVHASMFTPDGQSIITGHGGYWLNDDTNIRIWDIKSGSLIRTLTGHTKPVTSLDISPDGKTLISGSTDHTVKIWDLENDNEATELKGHITDVSLVLFNSNGKRALSLSTDSTIILWDIENKKEIQQLRIVDYSLRTAAWSPNSKQIAVGLNMGIYILDAENLNIIKKIDSIWNVNSISYSPDSRNIATGHWTNNAAVIYDIETGESFIQLGQLDASVIAVSYSKNGRIVFSATSDNTHEIGGKNIKVWNAETGELLATLTGHIGGINSIDISSDGKRIVSSSNDTTIRLWDLEYDEDIKSVTWKETAQFVGFMDGEWICVTTEGFYNASAGGADYLNVRIGDKVYGIEQFREQFRKPELVSGILSGTITYTDDKILIKNAGQFLPPVIEILGSRSNNVTNTAELSFNVYDENMNIARIEFFVNENQLGSDVLKAFEGNNDVTIESASLTVRNKQSLTFTIPIPLISDINHVKIRVYNNLGIPSERTLTISGTTRSILPNLWILAIGINTYEHTQQTTFGSLQYAAKDATEFVNCLKEQEGRIYGKVNYRLITDFSNILPTRENIINNLDYLLSGSSLDTVILFISGHGLNDAGDNFYLIPRDFNDSISLPDAAISNRLLSDALQRAPGNKFAFIDTCHSGNIERNQNRIVDTKELVSDLRSARTVLMAASDGSEESLENFLYGAGHGAFTYSLIEGLRGRADFMGRRRITLSALQEFVEANVAELTKNKQNTRTHYPLGFSGNPIMASLD